MTLRAMTFLVALSFAGCAGNAPPAARDTRPSRMMNATPDQVEGGRRIVELQCVSCHAVRSNDTSHNPDAPPLRTLAERYPVTGLPEAFALGIMKGHPDMPDFRFTPPQINAILAYLESVQTRQGAALDPHKSDSRHMTNDSKSARSAVASRRDANATSRAIFVIRRSGPRAPTATGGVT